MEEKKRTLTTAKLFGLIFFIIPPLFIFFQIYLNLKFEENPSSTSSIAYITGPIIGCFYGLIFGLFGLLLGKIIGEKTDYKRFSLKSSIIVLIITGVIAALSGSVTGYIKINKWNKKITPRIIFANTNIVKKEFETEKNYLNISDWFRSDNEPRSYQKRTIKLTRKDLIIKGLIKETYWENQKIYLCHDEDNAYILNKTQNDKYEIVLKQDIDNLTYITDVSGYEVNFNGQKYFALLIVLRATLRKSYLIIYSPDKSIAYKELTGRIRILTTRNIEGKDYLITGDERNPKNVYSWK